MKLVTINTKRSTRETILQTIKARQQVNVEDLADAADVSPVTVRHHLNSLQAEGLVESFSVRRKVGRPYYVYILSQDGQELFPKRYVRLTTRLLDELKARLPAEVVRDVFSNVVQGVIEDRQGEYEDLGFEDKLDYLVELLGEEGFLADWERSGNGYTLKEYSCPYISVGRDHAEICTIDRELILNVLQTPVEQKSCMLEGADCCEFGISTQAG